MISLALLGVIIYVAIGTIWYSPISPMGRLHMRYLGFDKLSKSEQEAKIAEAKPTMPKIYAAQMLLSLLTSAFTVFVVITSIQNGVPASMALAFPFLGWLCFYVPATGTSILWGNCEREIAWQKFFSDILSSFVSVMLIALIATFFA